MLFEIGRFLEGFYRTYKRSVKEAQWRKAINMYREDAILASKDPCVR